MSENDEQLEQQNIDSNTPLISVIVPIYNVEKQVRKCLDSLVNQTLKEVEIICIDDGSTDGSGRIADEYCNTYDRGNGNEWPFIRVIHTQNRGLSAARNLGIDEARAEWLMFVDSDDWVEDEFCEIPWKAAVENKADLVIFGSYETTKNGRDRRNIKKGRPSGVVDEITAHRYEGICPWNRIYRKKLFSSIRFPIGRLFEDYATTHKTVHIANRIVFINNCLYHHVKREGSISNSYTLDSINDHFVSNMERCEALVSYGFPQDEIDVIRCSAAIRYLARSGQRSGELFCKAENIMIFFDRVPKGLKTKQKVALYCWKKNNRLFFLICGTIGSFLRQQL